jgi:thiol-disulfide isomerase/thioredoxin
MMNKITITVIVVSILATLGILFCGGGGCSTEVAQKEVEKTKTVNILKTLGKMPAFSLSNYDGNDIKPEMFKGKILVVNSWAVWCPFCVKELSDFVELQKEFPDEIVVIAIDRAEPMEKAKEFTDSLSVSDGMVFLLDPKDSFYRSIGGFSMPETIFVDTSGEIRIHKRGPMELSEMRENVEKIINIK